MNTMSGTSFSSASPSPSSSVKEPTAGIIITSVEAETVLKLVFDHSTTGVKVPTVGPSEKHTSVWVTAPPG